MSKVLNVMIDYLLFYVPPRIFHSYGDVNNAGEGLKIKVYAWQMLRTYSNPEIIFMLILIVINK